MDLNRPTAGGRIRLSPTGDGNYVSERLPLEDPLEGATEAEREFYLQHYQGVPLAELLRRLRHAEWDAQQYRRECEQLREQARRTPPMHQVEAWYSAVQRVLGLLELPRRRSFTRAELQAAIDPPRDQSETAA